MKTSILSQKRFLKHILLLIVFLAYGVSSQAYISWNPRGNIEVNGVEYQLYYKNVTSSFSWNAPKSEYLAYVTSFTGSNSEVVIPEAVIDGLTEYKVQGLRYSPSSGDVTTTLSSNSVTTIRFESYIDLNPCEGSPTFDCPNLKNIYFEGQSPVLSGAYGDYFQSPAAKSITVYLSDKTQGEIDAMTQNSAVWCDFMRVAPISNANVKRNVNLSINHAKVEIDSDTYVSDASKQVDMYSNLTLKVYQGYDTYHVESVKLNGMEILGDMTFTQGAADHLSYYTYTLQNVTSDTYITVNGENINNEVTVICNQGGTYSSPNMNTSTVLPNVPTAIRWLKTAGNPTLKIIPNDGCTFDRLYYNSNDNTARATDNGDGTYSYTLTDDAYISLVFKDNSIIQFADPNVKALCVANWDKNSDGELSKAEAAAVTTLIDTETNKSVFYEKGATITSFDEFQYFTGLTAVEADAFHSDSLQSIILPATITEIQARAFSSNSSLKSVILPEGLTTIGVYAFNNTYSLEHIDLPESLTTIDAYAFYGSSLKQIFIPKNVNDLGGSSDQNPFVFCKNLVSIEVDEANETFNTNGHCNAIFKKLSSGRYLSVGCKTTVFPQEDSQRLYIGRYSFFGLGLKEIVFPANLVKIYDYAFHENNLEKIVVKMRTPIEYNRFSFVGSNDTRMLNCVVEVPYGTKEAYVQAGWVGEGDDGTQVVKQVVEAKPEGDPQAVIVPDQEQFVMVYVDEDHHIGFDNKPFVCQLVKGGTYKIAVSRDWTTKDIHLYVNGKELTGYVDTNDGYFTYTVANVTENLLVEVKYVDREFTLPVCTSRGGFTNVYYTQSNGDETSISINTSDGTVYEITEVKPGTDITFLLEPADGFSLGLVYCGYERLIGDSEYAEVTPLEDGRYRFVLRADQIKPGKTMPVFIYQKIGEDINFDLNNDSKIDIGDVTKLVNEVLKQHKP